MITSLKHQFKKLFDCEPESAFFAPGRVNLIGEHIDYNGGLVMPCAVNLGTYLLATPNNKGIFRFRSANFNKVTDILLKEDYTKRGDEWYNYPLGVIRHFLHEGKTVQGMDMLFYGDIPIGAGLSSSASIEIVTAFALNELFNNGFSKLELVKLARRVENEFIGLNCGIMDQFSVAFGQSGKALKLDCQTFDYEAINSNPGDHVLVIINTNKPRNLVGSKYNTRVEECRKALRSLQEGLSISNLCDIDTVTFNSNEYLISDEVIRKRARHVIEENDRVKLAAEALATQDLVKFGQLMYASHNSLKNLYEVSGKELDTIVEFCLEYPAVTGARMTGGGFGGCAIALVKESAFNDFSTRIIEYYSDRIGYTPSVYRTAIGGGVRRIESI